MNGITNPLWLDIKKIECNLSKPIYNYKNKYKNKNKDAYGDFPIQPLHN